MNESTRLHKLHDVQLDVRNYCLIASWRRQSISCSSTVTESDCSKQYSVEWASFQSGANEAFFRYIRIDYFAGSVVFRPSIVSPKTRFRWRMIISYSSSPSLYDIMYNLYANKYFANKNFAKLIYSRNLKIIVRKTFATYGMLDNETWMTYFAVMCSYTKCSSIKDTLSTCTK